MLLVGLMLYLIWRMDRASRSRQGIEFSEERSQKGESLLMYRIGSGSRNFKVVVKKVE